jgi:orotidine-5'-phosphate decarboxylase
MPIPERLKPRFGAAQIVPPDRMADARERLIVALDARDAHAANELVKKLEGTCRWFKVGLELFAAAGPKFVESLVASGCSVFLDLKFHDIPNTVAGAVSSAAKLGVRLLTVHAQGGPAMLEAARTALEGIQKPPQLLAVTVLTSIDQAQLKATGVARTPAKHAELLAKMGLKAQIRGFVCSPEEVGALRVLTGPDGVFAVPGIRPAGSEHDDQKRLATPADALRNGATYLVVGRPITRGPDPAGAASEILEEMAKALQEQLAL